MAGRVRPCQHGPMVSRRKLPKPGLIVVVLAVIGFGLWLTARSDGQNLVAVGVDLPPTSGSDSTTEPVGSPAPPAAPSTTGPTTTDPASPNGPTSVPPVSVPASTTTTVSLPSIPPTLTPGGAGGDPAIEYLDREGGIRPDAPTLESADSSTLVIGEGEVMLEASAEQFFAPEPLGGRQFRVEASVCEPDCEEILLPLDLSPAEATQVSADILQMGFELTQVAMSEARWRVHVDPANGALVRLEYFDGSSTTAFFLHRIVFFPPASGDGGARPPQP